MSNNRKRVDINSNNYYRIDLLPKENFERFIYQDIGDPGGLQRIAGQRKDKSWESYGWLIPKSFAHMEDNRLIADNDSASKLFKSLKSQPKFVRDNIFEAKRR